MNETGIFVSGQICKARWSNIRDNFRKSLQKNVTKSGQGRKSIKPYKYHEQLNFLLKFFEDRSNIENVNDDDDRTQNDESNTPEPPLPTQVTSPASESHSLTYSPTPSPASQHSQASARSRSGYKGRKENKDSAPTASSVVMDYLIRQNEHPVDMFLASLAPTLKELHPCDLFDAKSEIFAIVQKYESKLLRNKFPRLMCESSTITRQNRSLETVVVEDFGSAITGQGGSNVTNIETVVVQDRGSANTSQGGSNVTNLETVVAEDYGRVITSQDGSNANYDTVVVGNNVDNIILVKDADNKYTVQGIQEYYNSFKQ